VEAVCWLDRKELQCWATKFFWLVSDGVSLLRPIAESLLLPFSAEIRNFDKVDGHHAVAQKTRG